MGGNKARQTTSDNLARGGVVSEGWIRNYDTLRVEPEIRILASLESGRQ